MRTIKEMREALDSRKISAVELADKYLAAIAEKDGVIGAYLHVDEDVTRGMAAAAQKRIDAGEKLPMLGIPVGLKDILCTTDMPTTCASKILEGYMAPYDATVVRKLREAGAVFTGKLNMDEFAMGGTNMNSAYKNVRNPYNLDCISGGSSGGSAAAVAAGMCAVSLGTDTGGSVRQPAAFCGITGLRPTYGKVSRYGAVAFASSLDQIGPMGISAEDCGILLDTISGHDVMDMTSSSSHKERAAVSSLKGLKLGVIEEMTGNGIAEETRKAVLDAIDWYKRNGAEIEYVSLPNLKHCLAAYYLIASAEASANLGRFDGVRYGKRAEGFADYEELIAKSRAEGFGAEVQRRIFLGVYALCSGYYDAYYMKALHLANLVKAEYKRAFEKFDALLCPTSPDVAWEFDNVPSDDPTQVYVADLCTVSAPLANLPAVSTPCGYTADGRPIGLQITGNRFDDKFILSLAGLYEKEFARKEAVI